MKESRIIKAFTLAEVLITLSIIGVVAVLTISPVITSYKEKATITKVKKFYVEISNTFDLVQLKKGKVQYWGWGNIGDGEKATEIFNKYFAPYLNISKNCGTGEGCFKNSYFNTIATDRTKAKLSNGMSIAMFIYSPTCSVEQEGGHDICGEFTVDVNGDNGGEYGKDMFWFWITKNGIVPMGLDEEYFDLVCNENRYGCAAWVIEKGNQDYLRRTVSWDE